MLIHSTGSELLQIRLNDLDQLFRALTTGAPFMIRIDNMLPDMVLNDLSHQAVHGPARCDYQMENVGAALLFFDGAFQCFHLTENTSYSIQEFGLLFDGM